MMGTVDASLQSHAKAAGKSLSRDVSHCILFYSVGEILRRTVPGHQPYAIHFKVWQRRWTRYYELCSAIGSPI